MDGSFTIIYFRNSSVLEGLSSEYDCTRPLLINRHPLLSVMLAHTQNLLVHVRQRGRTYFVTTQTTATFLAILPAALSSPLYNFLCCVRVCRLQVGFVTKPRKVMHNSLQYHRERKPLKHGVGPISLRGRDMHFRREKRATLHNCTLGHIPTEASMTRIRIPRETQGSTTMADCRCLQYARYATHLQITSSNFGPCPRSSCKSVVSM